MHTKAAPLTKKLLIGNLSDKTANATLEDIFKAVGKVLSVAVVRNGFAFVEMTSADADKARRQLNGQTVDGKAMMIDEVHPRTASRF